MKDWICALGEQLYTVKTSHRSQMNPEKYIYNTAPSAQLQCSSAHRGAGQ